MRSSNLFQTKIKDSWDCLYFAKVNCDTVGKPVTKNIGKLNFLLWFFILCVCVCVLFEGKDRTTKIAPGKLTTKGQDSMLFKPSQFL